MSQNIDEVIEIDGLRSEGPWSNKSEALFLDLMDEKVTKDKKPTKC